MLHGGGQEEGLHLGSQAVVGVGYLQFKFEITEGAQTPQDHLGLAVAGELHGEAIETGHLHRAEMARGLPQLGQPLLQGEGRLLVGVLQHRHHHRIEQAGAALDQIEMPEGERVEAAWVESSHDSQLMGPEGLLLARSWWAGTGGPELLGRG